MATHPDLSDEDLARFREMLEKARRELLDQVADLDAEADISRWRDGGFDDDPADTGSANIERERAQSLSNHARRLLRQIEDAAARLDGGTYGECRRCGEPIGLPRLRAIPYAEYCLECKQLEERGR